MNSMRIAKCLWDRHGIVVTRLRSQAKEPIRIGMCNLIVILVLKPVIKLVIKLIIKLVSVL